MGHMISFLDLSVMNNCKKAVAPIVFQDVQSLAIGEGSTPIVVADVAGGAPAYYGGNIIVKGCYDIEVTISYLFGDDCDACTTPDTMQLTDITIVIPANSVFEIPEGYWQDIEFVVVDAAGAPVDLTGTQTETVTVYSAYKPECPECTVLAITP